jgi:hypothetical protein
MNLRYDSACGVANHCREHQQMAIYFAVAPGLLQVASPDITALLSLSTDSKLGWAQLLCSLPSGILAL